MPTATATSTESAPPVPRARRPWWQKLAIALMLFVWALVFGEIFLRTLNPQALVPRYVTGGTDGIRANMPDTTFRQWTPEVNVTLHYNDAGMRDDRPAPPIAKAPGECRIAVLGDSYFAGFESDWPHSYTGQLEEILGRQGIDCRVLNFAVSGFGHAEMLVALDSRAKQWQPDLVVVSIHATDGIDNIRAGLFRMEDDGTLIRTGADYLPGVGISDRLNSFALYRWAQENSHLYSAAREWLGRTGKMLLAKLRMQGTTDTEDEQANPPENAGSDKSFVGNRAFNQALARALAEQSREMEANILFVEIPTMGTRTRYTSVAADLLGEDLLTQFPFVSPIGRYREIMNEDTKIYLERGHRHWTELGNHEAAMVTAGAIISKDLLPAHK